MNKELRENIVKILLILGIIGFIAEVITMIMVGMWRIVR